MTDTTDVNDQVQAELERRLSLLEGPGSGDMIQPGLPAKDVIWLIAVLVTVSILLSWWAL